MNDFETLLDSTITHFTAEIARLEADAAAVKASTEVCFVGLTDKVAASFAAAYEHFHGIEADLARIEVSVANAVRGFWAKLFGTQIVHVMPLRPVVAPVAVAPVVAS